MKIRNLSGGKKRSLLGGFCIGIFKGQYYDSETGFHYNYHRYYDPQTGRYLRPDPIGHLGGINLYAYVGNNPVGVSDPRGLIVGSIISKITRKILGKTAQAAAIDAKVIDSVIGAVLTFDDGTIVPKANNQYINDVLLTLQGVGVVQTTSLAGGFGVAAMTGSAPVVVPVVLAGIAGLEIGGFFNDIYERFSGQMLGEDIYDWLHPSQQEESECE